MDQKVLYNLSYGVFMLGTKSGEKINGCITNTCIQVANSPTRVAISVLNSNYTCDLIKESKVFAVSILDKGVSFDTIKRFGFQSGRDVNKFQDFEYNVDNNGCPYLKDGACAVISCKVLSATDMGSHTLFIGEIGDGENLSSDEPLTYAYYQSDVKPKPQKVESDKKIKAWKCKICGYVYDGSELPKDFSCPLCGHGPEDFEPIYE